MDDIGCLFTTEREVGRVRISVSGEMDMAAYREFMEHVTQSGDEELLEVDLEAVTFLDSTGLRALLGAHQAVTARGASFAIVAMSETVKRLVALSGLAQHFGVQLANEQPRTAPRASRLC